MISKSIFLLFILTVLSGCGNEFAVSVNGVEKTVLSADGYQITTYELQSSSVKINPKKPKAFFFYIQGSEYESVLNKVEMLASAVIFGGRIVVFEKRGVYHDKVILDTCYKYSSKNTRVTDGIAVINDYLKNIDPSVPVILIGGSEGGDISSVIASRVKRITHLVLFGSGGGWSQETELKVLLKEHPGYFGIDSEYNLQNKFDEIHSDSLSLKLWLGHPYIRWSSYLKDSSLIYLKDLEIPIAVFHGAVDENVPVGSARELNKYFQANNKTNLTYYEYQNCDHSFFDFKKKISFYPQIETDLIKWLYEQKILNKTEMTIFIERIKDTHPDVFNIK